MSCKGQTFRALLCVLGLAVSGICSATEYLVVASKPNLLNIVDVKARTVEKSIEMPDAGPGA
ncbi:hypothetical protein [Granulosicoccus antarcticus]|uniref:Uncharacterized protein n=1 Tax=Granulosicoccus antarcticus IMCC3135 TaxID=1192854 RepID=A0A2Z2NRU4_9GAMM|nr:hypothetical protein [Granulosicoccus antarcticus]ASJ74093.1 hypothetical protein IMCC3135_20075 [Granulosicoccus antarcticus IMCC3135]